jgi:hypothetical protein
MNKKGLVLWILKFLDSFNVYTLYMWYKIPSQLKSENITSVPLSKTEEFSLSRAETIIKYGLNLQCSAACVAD